MKFGEPFNLDWVDGVQMRRRQAVAIRRRKEEEAALAEMDARQAAENPRLACRPSLAKLDEKAGKPPNLESRTGLKGARGHRWPIG